MADIAFVPELPSLAELAEARREVKKQFRRGRLFGEFKEHPLAPFVRAGFVSPTGERIIEKLEALCGSISGDEAQRIADLASQTLPK